MQLRLDAADRLVELVEERRGPVPAEEAARHLFALRQLPVGLARGLLEDCVGADARLSWRGDLVALAAPAGAEAPLESAAFTVVDLETTGLSARRGDAICEIGAVRVEALELRERFQTLANPGTRLGAGVEALTGLRDAELRRAPPVAAAVRAFLAFAGDRVLVAHNARFDIGFLDAATERLTGRRVGSVVVDTVGLARRLVGGRRANLAELAVYFGTAARPCHRALPDAEATAEILLALIGLAQERGARTVADLCDLAATRARRAHAKRSLAYGAPTRPGVYLFRDAHDRVLYVGRARDLRARLRSYFRSDRQRPAVEAALGALDRIEWRVLGSELEAALEELRLIRELRPAANARSVRPDRYVYLRSRGGGGSAEPPGSGGAGFAGAGAGGGVGSTEPPGSGGAGFAGAGAGGGVGSTEPPGSAGAGFAGAGAGIRVICSSQPSPLGPLKSRARARLAARALESAGTAEIAEALPRLRARLRRLAADLRFEDAARVRDRLAALEAAAAELAELERLRGLELCLLAPALEPGFRRAFFVAGGRVAAARTLPPGAGSRLELDAGLAAVRAAGASWAPEDADELLVLASFLRRPPPELEVRTLDALRRAS